MSEQEPKTTVTVTERQIFTGLLDVINCGTFPGTMVVKVAEAKIFCERVIQNSDPGVMQPTPSKESKRDG